MGAAPVQIDPMLAALFAKPKRKRGALDIAGDQKSQGFAAAPRPRHASGGSSAGGLSPASRIRNAYAVPQAVVKITRNGRTSGGNALRNQLQYISREGRLDVETNGGTPVDGGPVGRFVDLAQSWDADFAAMDKRSTFTTYHVVVSYPKGTDPVAARLAACAFAEELTNGRFGDHYRYAMAHHRDTAYAHTHIILNRAGAEGSTLHLSRHSVSVQDLRELHAETARDCGIELNATSRFSRGVDERPLSSGRIHAQAAGRELASPPTPSPEKSESASPKPKRFPFYGASQRQVLGEQARSVLWEAQAQSYMRLARALSAIKLMLREPFDTKAVAERLVRASTLVRDGRSLEPGDRGRPLQPPVTRQTEREAQKPVTAKPGAERTQPGANAAHGSAPTITPSAPPARPPEGLSNPSPGAAPKAPEQAPGVKRPVRQKPISGARARARGRDDGIDR